MQTKFKADAPELNGIDIIKNEHPGIKFESGDFLEMKFDEGYNIITSFMVIEHVIDPHLFINKMVESLTDNGVIVVNTINNGSLIYRVARFLNNLGFPTSHDRLYNHHHLQHYTNKSLKTLLETELPEVIFDAEYELESKKIIYRIYVPFNDKFSIYNKNSWRDCFEFYFETMEKFELFFYEYEEVIKNI